MHISLWVDAWNLNTTQDYIVCQVVSFLFIVCSAVVLTFVETPSKCIADDIQILIFFLSFFFFFWRCKRNATLPPPPPAPLPAPPSISLSKYKNENSL